MGLCWVCRGGWRSFRGLFLLVKSALSLLPHLPPSKIAILAGDRRLQPCQHGPLLDILDWGYPWENTVLGDPRSRGKVCQTLPAPCPGAESLHLMRAAPWLLSAVLLREAPATITHCPSSTVGSCSPNLGLSTAFWKGSEKPVKSTLR